MKRRAFLHSPLNQPIRLRGATTRRLVISLMIKPDALPCKSCQGRFRLPPAGGCTPGPRPGRSRSSLGLRLSSMPLSRSRQSRRSPLPMRVEHRSDCDLYDRQVRGMHPDRLLSRLYSCSGHGLAKLVGNTAYVGLTGETGWLTATQNILTWTYGGGWGRGTPSVP